MRSIRIILVGSSGVGKTAFLVKHKEGSFLRNHVPTFEMMCMYLEFETTMGRIGIRMYDILDLTSSEADEILYIADAAFVMFDVENQDSFKNAGSLVSYIRARMPKIPIVVLGNKVDSGERQVSAADIKFHKEYDNCVYFDYSVRSSHNFEKPFLHAIREVLCKMARNVQLTSYKG